MAMKKVKPAGMTADINSVYALTSSQWSAWQMHWSKAVTLCAAMLQS
jgi:hypothetical protein